MEKNIQHKHKDIKFYGSLDNYSNEDFISLVDSKYGWAHKDQIDAILNGDKYEDQNDSAIEDIARFAASKKEIQLSNSIYSWLEMWNKIESEPNDASIPSLAQSGKEEERFEPGPWILGGASGRMITTPSGYYGDGFIADVDTLANATLIAAAPELYYALKEMYEFFTAYVPLVDHNGRSLHNDWSYEKVVAALSKASPKQ